MKHSYLKYFLYLCIVSNFIVSNSNEAFLQPGAHESSLHDKITNHEPRVFILKEMRYKKVSVEVDGVFYESMNHAGRKTGHTHKFIKARCLSEKFPNYKIVPYRITYTEKKCTKCGESKLLKEFDEGKTNKDGIKPKCKKCRKKYQEERRKNNPEHDKQYYQNNKKEFKRRSKKRDEENPNYKKEHGSRPEVKSRRNKKERKRRRTDMAFKINGNMSVLIGKSLKGMKNGEHWEDLTGWTVEELRAHLESLFTDGMNWDNYGKGKYKWCLDHVIARCHFNVTSNTCQALKDCWALDNLQPLWWIRNIEKGNKSMHPKYLIKPF